MHPVLLALIANCLTYVLTAVGAAGVFVLDTRGERATDSVMAIAAGLMLAAVTSLLTQGVEGSKHMGMWGFVPITVGFGIAVAIMWLVDFAFRRHDQSSSPNTASGRFVELAECGDGIELRDLEDGTSVSLQTTAPANDSANASPQTGVSASLTAPAQAQPSPSAQRSHRETPTAAELRKARLFVFALAVQHIPEALAVGVACAVRDKFVTMMFESKYLAFMQSYQSLHSEIDDVICVSRRQGVGTSTTSGAAISLALAIGLQVMARTCECDSSLLHHSTNFLHIHVPCLIESALLLD